MLSILECRESVNDLSFDCGCRKIGISMITGHARFIARVACFVASASAVLLFVASGKANACVNAQTCSNNYQVNEAFFGTGGSLDTTCSGTYCAKQSAGELGVGNTSGTAYQAQAGFNTDRAPSLTFIVNSATISLGTLTPGTTTTATATFSVKTYLASGYVVTLASDPPTAGTYTMKALSTPTAANTSQEQFGINLVANTVGCGAPANFGSNPAQVPDSTFSFGAAATGYNTCGLFKYVKGDTIALATKSSGETDYTISYIFGVTNVTPGGTYSMSQVLVATSTF